ALAMPALLKELKARGYRIVHAVPPGQRPKFVPEPNAPALVASLGWPRTLPAGRVERDDAPNGTADRSSGYAAMKPAASDRKQHEPTGRGPDAAKVIPVRK